jgi:hypothetical protein
MYVCTRRGEFQHGKLTFQAASPAVLANKGTRHCGQANPVDSKPRGLGQLGRKILRASYEHLTASPLANEGERHCGQAESMVAVIQKGNDGTAAHQSKQQSKSKPQWSRPNGTRPRASYQFLLQHAEWRSCHKDVDFAGELT